MIKDIFCDVDGTLLINDEVSSDDISAIKRFVKQGGRFHIITGRTVSEIQRIVEKYDIPATYQIGNNGGAAIVEGKIVFDEHINPQINHDLLASVQNYFDISPYFEITSGANVYINRFDADNSKFEFKFADMFHISEYNPQMPISKFYFEATPEQVGQFMQDAQKKFPDQMEYFSDITAVNVGPKNVSKGVAVKHFMDRDKIKSAAIGDGGNDIPMFKVADSSYTFFHASEHVQKEADNVVKNVAHAIDEIMNRW